MQPDIMNPQSVLYLTALMELGAGLPTLLVPNGFVSRRIFGKSLNTTEDLVLLFSETGPAAFQHAGYDYSAEICILTEFCLLLRTVCVPSSRPTLDCVTGKMTGTSGQLLWSCLAIAVGLMCYSLANTGNSAAISSGLFGMLAYHILLVGLSVNSFLKKLTNGLYSRNHELPDPLPVFVAHGLMGVITYFSWQASGAKSVW